jgi:dipeptidyl aminopeptidase/acylaminoacyl peptidase
MKNQKQSAPCGTWVSPVTADAVTASSVGLGGLSSDGGTLYWLEGRPSEQGRSALVRRKPDGTVEDVTPAPVNVASRVHEYGGGSYAVDNNRIVYTEKKDCSVWLIENNAAPRKIAEVKDCRYADFRFVPGTDQIVCVREDHRNRKPTDPEAAIVVLDTAKGIDAATNEGTVLAKGGDFFSSPRLSPDGKKIAWLTWQHPDMPWDATQLHVADFTAAGLKNIKTVAGHEQREAIVQPEWSPEGTLHFCTDRSDWWNVYKLGAKGVEAVTSVPDGEIGGPHWVFGGSYYAFKPDGSLIAELSQNGQSHGVAVKDGNVSDLPLQPVGDCPVLLPGGAMAYVAVAPDTRQAIRLYDSAKDTVIKSSGPDIIAAENISKPEEITFPTADGGDAHAFYYPPVNGSFKPLEGEKPPLIVMIHGGPTSAASTGFSPAKQFWTSRGFAVVDVNYRGSTGYGRAYREKLNGAWGVADVEDCVAAVKFLAGEGRIDPDRVAIRGGSAGGFTVLAGLTTSDVFKAGASHYGVGDLMLLAHETHKFESRYLDRLIGPLPEAEQVYKDRSPVNHLDKMAGAAIFFQGLDDKVVPPSQAQTMVDAMRAKNMPVAHYEFEGEGHGFRKGDTQKRVLDLELGFYAKLFGFTAPGLSEKVEISGLEDKPAQPKTAPKKAAPPR